MHLAFIPITLVLFIFSERAAAYCSAQNYNCPRSLPCCSKFGFCGNSYEHCGPRNCVAGCDFKGSYSSSYDGLSSAPINYEQLRAMKDQGVYSRCKNPKHIALTFDDGVNSYRMSISRFQNLEKSQRNKKYSINRRILRKMFEEGHDIGSHSFDHPDLTTLGNQGLVDQVLKTETLIEHTIGYKPKFLRAPMGSVSEKVLHFVRDEGYAVIHWNLDPEDWKYHQWNPHHMLDVIKNIPPAKRGSGGAIILQHDTIDTTVDQQGSIIDELRAKGYEIVPMRTCLDLMPYRE